MISFLSILLWNAGHPRYFDILFFRQDLRDFQDVFLVFLFGQGLCWKLVTAPAWIAISLVPSLMASSSTDQLPFLFPLRLLKEFVPLPYCLVWQNIKVAYLWISGRQFSDIFQLKKRAILVSCTQLTRNIFYPPGGHQVLYICLPQSTF